jgi:hypothetical protein
LALDRAEGNEDDVRELPSLKQDQNQSQEEEVESEVQADLIDQQTIDYM